MPTDRSTGRRARARRAAVAALLGAILLGALGGGCARSDLGAPCHLQDALGAEVRPEPGREYLYLGSSECSSFTCLATPGASGGYCSQPCSTIGQVCPSGLVCAQTSLDQGYLAAMRARLTPERYQQLFGQLSGSAYCKRVTR